MTKDKKTEVVIYTSPFCGMCHSLMEWLSETGVLFSERNVEDENSMQELLALTNGQFDGTPVTVIGSDVVEGFDRPRILELLGEYNIPRGR